MRRRRSRGCGAALRACVTGAVLAGLAVTGCGGQGAGQVQDAGQVRGWGHQRGTVESCIQFGIRALRRHADVVSVPAACRGLTRAQVNFAVGSALHAVADTGHGKAGQRERAIRLSPLLGDLVTAVPAQPGPPPATGPPGRPPGPPAPPAPLGLLALACWLVTAGLGTWMTARWILRGGLRRPRTGAGRRAGLPPPLILGHLGLAVAGLLAWIGYLATGLAGAGWAACAVLLPVTGLGMALVSLGPADQAGPANRSGWSDRPGRPRGSAPPRPARVPAGLAATVPGPGSAVASAPASPASPVLAPAPAGSGPRRAGPPPALIVAAHGVFAVMTMLFALLAVIGAG